MPRKASLSGQASSAAEIGRDMDYGTKPRLEKPTRKTAKNKKDQDEARMAVNREDSDDSDSLLSSLSALKLEPSGEQVKDPSHPVARRSPRKPAPRQRPFWTRHPSIDIELEPESANEDDEDEEEGNEDDSALSDFIVDDSASETELRKPSRSTRKPTVLAQREQQQQKSRRRLVQRSPTKKPPSVYEDSDEDVRVSKPREEDVVLDLTTPPLKRPSRGSNSLSDKENEPAGTAPVVFKDSTLNLTDKLDNALRFSPPGNKKHSGDASETHTPPSSPSRTRLQSPSRTRVNIPDSPHRQSIDAFWDQGVVDQWNDVHSPKKTPAPAGRLLPLLLSPTKSRGLLEEFDDSDSGDSGYETPSARSPKKNSLPKSPSKLAVGGRDRVAMEAKKKFENEKHELASRFLAELDRTITKGEIARLSASTGGVKLEWNKKLNSTAGRAKWKREKTRVTGPPASSPSSSSSTSPSPGVSEEPTQVIDPTRTSSTATSSSTCSTTIVHHYATIELASKVIDNSERLLNVLAHEFCHLTTFMISHVKDNPHGREFKSWAAKVTQAFAGRGVNVTTKHSYEIDYKYIWACTTCAAEYKRHSKSIDPAKHICSSCKDGKLLQIQPAVRGNAATIDGFSYTKGGKDELGYNAYVKANFAAVKAELESGNKKHPAGSGSKSPVWGEVMGELAKRWRALKAKKSASASSSMKQTAVKKTKTTAEVRIADSVGQESSSPSSFATSPRSDGEAAAAAADVDLVTDGLGDLLLGSAA